MDEWLGYSDDDAAVLAYTRHVQDNRCSEYRALEACGEFTDTDMLFDVKSNLDTWVRVQ